MAGIHKIRDLKKEPKIMPGNFKAVVFFLEVKAEGDANSEMEYVKKFWNFGECVPFLMRTLDKESLY